MDAITIGLQSEEAVATEKASGKSGVHPVLTVSVLLGPLVYLVCRATSQTFASGSQMLTLIAFFVIGFELVWLTYGFIALVSKGLKGRQGI